MARQNCWEFQDCGRGLGQSGGEPCPAATETRLDGVNQGVNAGRACWVVSGTLCEGRVQGSRALREGSCSHCDFYWAVRRDEGLDLGPGLEVIARLRRECG